MTICTRIRADVNVTFTGDGKEDETNSTSKVEVQRKSKSPFTAWCPKFTLGGKSYVLVVRDGHDTVTATEDTPEEKEGKREAYFVPVTVGGPFEILVLMDTNKCLAVNMALTIKEPQDTEPSYKSFVIDKIS